MRRDWRDHAWIAGQRALTLALVLVLAAGHAQAQDIIGKWRGQMVSPEGKTVTMIAELGCGNFGMTRIVDEPARPGRAGAPGKPPIAAVPPHQRRDHLTGTLFYDAPQLMFEVERWSPDFGPEGPIPKPEPFALRLIEITERFLVVEDPFCVANPGKLTNPSACRFMLHRTR